MRKKILLVLILCITAVILSGCVSLPEEENNTTVNEDAPDLNTSRGAPVGGGDDGGDNNKSNNETNNQSGNQSNIGQNDERESLIENVSEETEFTEEQLENASIEELLELQRRVTLPVQCEERGQDGLLIPATVDSIRVAGETLNVRRLESMIHDEFNKIRERRKPLADPLKCDPQLREIARQNSKSLISSPLNPDGTGTKYDGAPEKFRYNVTQEVSDLCRDWQITESTWYYRNILSQERKVTDQSTERLDSHRDFLVDIKNAYGAATGYNAVSDTNNKIHGTGVYINRETGYTGVTHIICS